MSLLDNVKSLFANTETKAPDFSISEYGAWEDYSSLLRSDNYLDQYFGWTYKAVKIVADSIASTTPKLLDVSNEDEYEEVKENQLIKDLQHFNPYMTFYDARKLKELHIRLTGKAYWYMVKSDTPGFRREFYPLNPQRIHARFNSYGLPEVYVHRATDGKETTIQLQDIIVFTEPDPKNWIDGYSPLQATRYQHNSSEFALRYNMNFFGNNAKPEGFLYVEGLENKQRKAFEKQLRAKYGGVNNAGALGVVSRLVQWVGLNNNLKEMQYIEGLKLMRDDILSIHGVPHALVGLNDSTYQNSKEAQRIFQQYTLKPSLELEKQVLNEQLLTKYPQTELRRGKFMFDYDDPVQMDFELNAKSAALLFEKNVISRAQAKALIDIEPEDGDEMVYAGSQAQQQVEAVAKDTEEVMDEVKKLKAEIKSLPSIKQQKQENRENLRDFFYTKSLQDEKKIKDVADAYFADQQTRVLATLEPKKSVDMTIGFDAKEEEQIAIALFEAIYGDLAREYNSLANQMTGFTQEMSKSAKKALKKNLEYFAKEINDTTEKQLNELLAKAIENGWSINETRDKIGELYTGFTKVRSEAIARTETNKIKGLMMRDNYERNKYVEAVEWLSARDGDVRDAHAKADGQVQVKGQAFDVDGEKLKYPGDPSGSADNTINCRCTLLPVVNV